MTTRWSATRLVKLAAHLAIGGLVVFVATWRAAVPDAPSDELAYRHCGDLYVHGGRLLWE